MPEILVALSGRLPPPPRLWNRSFFKSTATPSPLVGPTPHRGTLGEDLLFGDYGQAKVCFGAQVCQDRGRINPWLCPCC